VGLGLFSIVKLSIRLALLSSVSICLSFIFQWYVITQLGPGANTDALFAGMTLPQLVLAIISGSLMQVLVPLLSGENKNRFQQDEWSFLALIFGLFGFLSILFYITAIWWIPLTVPGFDNAKQILTVKLTRIQIVGMVFTAINSVQWAAYHARQKFMWVEFTSIFASIIALLLLIWLLPLFGVVAAAWISSLRIALQTLLLAPGMGRPVWPDLKSPSIQQAWLRIKHLLLGTAYYKTEPLIDSYMLSTATSGSLSLYYLAQQIYGAISQVINKAIAAPLVPLLSIFYKAGDKASFQRAYYRKLLQVITLSMATLLVFVLFGHSVLRLFIEHGNVTAKNLKDIWWIMILLSGMLIGGTAGQVTSITFYSIGDTITPTRMSMLTYTLSVPAKVASFYFYGLVGLAIVTSIYYMINLFLQIYLLWRKSIC
jgi:putative peptidoglycan lipid II flippase